MPQKYTIKDYAPNSYYHVYSRGSNKQNIFPELADYRHFRSLFERYLSNETKINKGGVTYPNYHKDIKLLSYCLMSNHVHLLIHQAEDAHALRRFMSSVMTSYSKYFNLKYKRYGSVFESRYKAKRINSDAYLSHISRYIHMNPRRWEAYRQSSLQYVFAKSCPNWLAIEEVVADFKNKDEYLAFLRDYQESKDSLEAIKHLLADN